MLSIKDIYENIAKKISPDYKTINYDENIVFPNPSIKEYEYSLKLLKIQVKEDIKLPYAITKMGFNQRYYFVMTEFNNVKYQIIFMFNDNKKNIEYNYDEY